MKHLWFGSNRKLHSKVLVEGLAKENAGFKIKRSGQNWTASEGFRAAALWLADLQRTFRSIMKLFQFQADL